jgi:uncharacterized metal-binding protein YceD (DUF177 family)
MTDDDFVLPFDWVHDRASLSEKGTEQTRRATAEERARLVAALDLAACDRVEVVYRVKPLSGFRARLKGRITAHVVQKCVVSLAPVPADVAVDLAVEFWPAEEAEESVDFDPMSNADPEPMENGRIEVGRIVYEEIAAALDPYPRAPDATFAPGSDAEVAAEKPFAALARWKRQE